MTVIPLHPLHRFTPAVPPIAIGARENLLALMLGPAVADAELPPLPELLGALLGMAAGTRQKSLFPLGSRPAEYALLRRGANVLLSYYHTESSPDVVVLDRRVPLRLLLDATAAALTEELAGEPDTWARELGARLVQRASEHPIVLDADTGASATRRSGGAVDDPGEKHAVAFGFEAAIFPSADPGHGAISHADVHAMLFGGSLWAWVRGRRVPLCRGPILLAVHRMVSAVRVLVEAADEDRAMNVRLRSGSFVVGIRRDKGGEVALTLGSEDDGVLTVPALDLTTASLPVLRVASDVVRALLSVDRTQARNLRIVALRDEVRRLRRLVRSRARAESLVNEDPDRLRASAPPVEPAPQSPGLSPRHLRFVPRWSASVDGLDAAGMFLCRDRVVLATARRTIALDRDLGQVVWQREAETALAFLAGAALVRLGPDGSLELRDVDGGEALLRTRTTPRLGGPALGLAIGGGSVPPAAVVAEGRDRLVAIDLRTGEPRWRFSGRGAGDFRITVSGRLLVVATGDGHVHALDGATGEVAWRHAAAGARFATTPLVSGETVLALSGEPARADADVVGIDLWTGRERYRRPLGGPVACAPIAAAGGALVAIGGRRATLGLFDVETGEARWRAPDPALGAGGAVLPLDRAILLHSPKGTLTALDPERGEVLWSRVLAHPVSDDVPRRLDPVLRSGALFVPSAAVHVLRPGDGSSIGAPLPCELVPDAMRVDERGWVYVAEESGHLAALAPAAHLTLVG